MSTVSIDTYEAGDLISAAAINTDFTSIATVSQDLDQENTRTEWCSRFHLKKAGAPYINTNFAQVEDSDTIQTINTNVFTQVNLNPAFRITYTNLTVLPGEVVRLHFDVNVVDPVIPNNASSTLTDITDDCYQFRFYYRDANSGLINPIGCTSTYSTSNKSDHNSSGTGGGNPGTQNRFCQRVNHSFCWINTTGANIVIDWIEVRCRLANLAYVTSIGLTEGTFQAFRARH